MLDLRAFHFPTQDIKGKNQDTYDIQYINVFLQAAINYRAY